MMHEIFKKNFDFFWDNAQIMLNFGFGLVGCPSPWDNDIQKELNLILDYIRITIATNKQLILFDCIYKSSVVQYVFTDVTDALSMTWVTIMFLSPLIQFEEEVHFGDMICYLQQCSHLKACLILQWNVQCYYFVQHCLMTLNYYKKCILLDLVGCIT